MHDVSHMVYYTCGDVPMIKQQGDKMDDSVDAKQVSTYIGLIEELQEKIHEQDEEIDLLEKKILDTERNKKYYYDQYSF